MNNPEQRTDDWRAVRAGKITGSCFKHIVEKTKTGKPLASREKYLHELVFEIMSGTPKHEISGRSLSWGTDVEQYAKEAYELETGHFVFESGFIQHPLHEFIGVSPDGLISEDGAIEIKCPHDEAVHVETLLSGMPEMHIPQVQGVMYVTGRKWVDFISYDPRQAEEYRLYVQRIERDDTYIESLDRELLAFWCDVQACIQQLKQRKAA